MSVENVRLFHASLIKDNKLRQALAELVTDSQWELTAVLRFAGEQGYHFDQEHLKIYSEEMLRACRSSGELNDNQLDTVSGGGLVPWLLLSIFTFTVACMDYLQKGEERIFEINWWTGLRQTDR